MPTQRQPADFDPWDPPPTANGSRPRRRKRDVDNGEFLAFAVRILRAAQRRIADADPEDLADMVTLRAELDAAIGAAARAQNAAGRSWADIAAPLGMTRQAAFQRWAKPPPGE